MLKLDFEWSFKTLAILGGRTGLNKVLRQSGVQKGEWSFKTLAILARRKGQNQVLRQLGVNRLSEVLRH